MFGEYLLSKNLISKEQLEEALSIQPMVRKKIGRILVELDILTRASCDLALSNYLNIEFEKNLLDLAADKNFQTNLKLVERSNIKGYFLELASAKLFMREFSDHLIEEVEKSCQEFEVKLLSQEQWALLCSMCASEPSQSKSIGSENAKVELNTMAATPYKDLLMDLLKRAKDCNASDVHFDSTLEGLSIRFRVNGDLSIVKNIRRELTQSFLTEVKAQTGLPLTVIGSPCSGAARFANLNLKVRAQSNGQIHGETIVLRLINEDKIKGASIDSIGADSMFEADLREALSNSNGLILMCGQTGSGKSWTLYSLLMSLDRQTSKIITIEDPVEYEGTGLMQIEVTDGKVNFQEALRSSLRLDPDIIMIGEIRDEETAELAFKAASTGHLVFSTLHTNGALEALSRLKGLGIAEDMIESNVRLIAALTLKKELCGVCKIPISPNEAEAISDEFGALSHLDVQFFKRNASGCSHTGCYQGAIGRVLLYESMTQEQIKNFREGLMVPDFRSLKQCALEKAAKGIIGIEEVLHV